MSDSDQSYSPFWAILALIIGLILFESVQVFGLYSQASTDNKIINNASPQLNASVGAHNKLISLAQDVYNLAQKGDPGAAELVNKFQIRPNATGTNGAPANPGH